jgi:hypothetical protein
MKKRIGVCYWADFNGSRNPPKIYYYPVNPEVRIKVGEDLMATNRHGRKMARVVEVYKGVEEEITLVKHRLYRLESAVGLVEL